MQLSLLTHLSEVRMFTIIGATLVVSAVIFYILKKKKKLTFSALINRFAVFFLVTGIVCLIPGVYYISLNADYGISEYTDSDILYLACESSNESAVGRMLSLGASPTEKTRFGKSSLVRSIEKGDLAAVDLMIKSGMDVNKAGEEYTPLGFACKAGDNDMVRLLLDNGALPDYMPHKYPSALTCAAAFDSGYNYELIEMLCDAGADRQSVSFDERGRRMVPFKYYFRKTVGEKLNPMQQKAYNRIAELLEKPYRDWVVENTDQLGSEYGGDQ